MKNLKNKKVLSNDVVRKLFLEDFEIPADKVSDVIVPVGNFDEEPTGAYNLMTKQMGDSVESVIREGKPFIYLQNETLTVTQDLPVHLTKNCGVYAVKSNIADVLTVIICELVLNEDGTYCWEEATGKGGFFGRARSFLSESYIIPGNKSPLEMFLYCSSCVDICGQSKMPIYGTSSPSPVSFKKAVYDYFGGIPMYKYDGLIIIAPDIDRIINYHIRDAGNDEYVGVFESGCSSYFGKIPKRVEEAFLRFMKSRQNPYRFVSYLQETKDGFVQRDFLPIENASYSTGDSTFEFYELRRILMKPECYKKSVDFSFIGGTSVVLWYDGINDWSKKQPFPGAAQNLLDFMISAAYSEKYDVRWDKKVMEETGVSPANIAQKLCFVLDDELGNKIFGADLGMESSIHLFSLVPPSLNTLVDNLNKVFGTINKDGRTIDEVLNIPNGMANEALVPYKTFLKNNDNLIKDCKKVFESFFNRKKAMEYFMRMSREDYKELMNVVYANTQLPLDKKCEMLRESNCLNNWKVFLAK